MKVVLIYHDPGVSEGHNIVRSMAAKLEMKLGEIVEAYPISSIENKSAPIEKGDIVFALLPFRGGHLSQIEKYVNAANATLAGKIPLEIIVENSVNALKGCKKIIILYWKAKRRVEEQLEDLNYLASKIKESLGNVEVDMLTDCNSNCKGCVIVTSLLPGRLTLEAASKGADVRVPYLLAVIEDDVVSWIEDILVKFRSTSLNS